MSAPPPVKFYTTPGGRLYALARTRRRTVGLYVRPDGCVEVRAPLRLDRHRAEAFVDQKAAWLDRQIAAALAAAGEKAAFAVEPGCELLWLGEAYPAVLRPDEKGRAAFDGHTFYLPYPDAARNRPAVAALYRGMAPAYLKARAAYFAGEMGLAPKSVKVTGAKARWGSCSGKNALCFAWRLALTPPACVDYVAVHELCHMKEHNHSPAFWREVAAQLPDYASRRALLAEFGRRIALQDWEPDLKEEP